MTLRNPNPSILLETVEGEHYHSAFWRNARGLTDQGRDQSIGEYAQSRGALGIRFKEIFSFDEPFAL
jgi:hypothetical protein